MTARSSSLRLSHFAPLVRAVNIHPLTIGLIVAGFPSVKKGNKLGEPAKRPHAGIALDKKTIAELITRCQGNVSRIADTIGSNRNSVHNMIHRDDELKQLLKDARERQLDELEQSVFERAIETNDTTLQLFLLKTQGKSRGYEQSEAQNTAKDIATAAFDFIINKSKNPAEPSK